MNSKKTIRKVLFISMWLVIGGGMITLLAAAIRYQKNDRCRGYNITIKGADKNLFVDKKDVIRMITDATGGKIKGQPMSSFKLRQLEQLLKDNVWVRNAELYFDNKDVLRVTITEREPIARVFTVAGKSFYIDAEEKRMPLSGNRSAKVPVFTGFPPGKLTSRSDSALLHEIKELAVFINMDSFWTAQIAQVDITPQREFEMVPVVGNHVVKFGKGDNIAIKFNRLFLFYKNVLSQAGFDKYQAIDVQYAGQVVGVKGNVSKVDSVQLRRNIEQLLQQARDMQNDTSVAIAPVIAKPGEEARTEKATDDNSPGMIENESGPNPLKISESKPVAPVNENPKSVKREPKAVMPKQE